MGAAMFSEATIWRLFEYGGGRPSLDGTELSAAVLFRPKCSVFGPRAFVSRLELDDGNGPPTRHTEVACTRSRCEPRRHFLSFKVARELPWKQARSASRDAQRLAVCVRSPAVDKNKKSGVAVAVFASWRSRRLCLSCDLCVYISAAGLSSVAVNGIKQRSVRRECSYKANAYKRTRCARFGRRRR